MTLDLDEFQFFHLLKNINNKKYIHNIHTPGFFADCQHHAQIMQYLLAAYNPITGLGYKNSVNKLPDVMELSLAGKTEIK